jgi:CheY-like chemotaxis protein
MVTGTRPDTGDTPTEHAHRFSILVADDDRGNREALGEVLGNQGFHTVLAADGGEAVEIVQVEMIHLVLFDMHMPRLTGLEALTLLRHSLGRVLPAVLMTADATTELMRQAFQAQVYSVIPKPVNKNIVLHTLARALARVYGTPPTPAPPPTTDSPGPAHDGPARTGDRESSRSTDV